MEGIQFDKYPRTIYPFRFRFPDGEIKVCSSVSAALMCIQGWIEDGEDFEIDSETSHKLQEALQFYTEKAL